MSHEQEAIGHRPLMGQLVKQRRRGRDGEGEGEGDGDGDGEEVKFDLLIKNYWREEG